jgi:hypothetical protein
MAVLAGDDCQKTAVACGSGLNEEAASAVGSQSVQSSSFDLQHLVETTGMTFLWFVPRVEERFDDLESEFRTDDPPANAQHIHVVVLDSLMGRVGVVADRGTDAGDFIGRDTDTYAASTNDDPTIDIARNQLSGDGNRKIGVITARLGIGPAVNERSDQRGKPLGDGLFQWKAGVVATEGDPNG